MPYVKRDDAGEIVGRFMAPQPDATEWVDDEEIAPDLTVQKADAAGRIDAAAGAARARYITVAAGQGATYIVKAAQAHAYLAASGGSVPAFVQAEADATGRTALQAAQAIVDQEALWIIKGAQIERLRRGGKVATAAAADAAGIASALESTIAELAGV